MYASTLTYVQAQSEGHSFHLGQILIISNRDTESTSGFADIPYGSTVMFIYDGQRYFCHYMYVSYYLQDLFLFYKYFFFISFSLSLLFLLLFSFLLLLLFSFLLLLSFLLSFYSMFVSISFYFPLNFLELSNHLFNYLFIILFRWIDINVLKDPVKVF